MVRAGSKLPMALRVACAMLLAVFALPVAWGFLGYLFTGHRREDATLFDALWRVPAILAAWIGFAKVNEEYIRPALRDLPFLNRPGGLSVMGNARHKAVTDKRVKAMDLVKAKMAGVIKRRKTAEKLVEEKSVELEAAKKSAQKSQRLFDKKKQLQVAANEDDQDINDECEALGEMAMNAQKYVETVTAQIKAAKNDIQECGACKKELQKEWDAARSINSETTFYR